MDLWERNGAAGTVTVVWSAHISFVATDLNCRVGCHTAVAKTMTYFPYSAIAITAVTAKKATAVAIRGVTSAIKTTGLR